MSKVFGIIGHAHDSTVAYIEDGEIKVVIEEERIRKIKSWALSGVYPWFAMDTIENDMGYKLEDSDYICIAEVAEPDLDRYKSEEMRRKVVTYPHHLLHAVGAYYTSGFKEKTLVITHDGSGFKTVGRVYLGYDDKLHLVHKQPKEKSASIGQYIGRCTTQFAPKGAVWHSLKDEGKLMGMAGHGKYNEEMYNKLKQLLHYTNDLNFGPCGNWNRVETFFESLREEESDWSDNFELRAEWAFNVQKLLEDVFLEYLEDLHKFYPEYKRVAVAGGIFANVKLNQKINELDWVDEVYVYPAMSDSGLALAAAIMKSVELGEWENKRFENVFLGNDYTKDEIKKEEKEWNFNKEKFDSKKVAKLLNDGNIIGCFQGKMEYGPRALGSRSILVRATDKEMHETLNNRLERHEIMPFAPIILGEKVDDVCKNTKSKMTAEFMTMCYTVKDEWVDKIPAVVHRVDNTLRPQLVFKERNKFFHSILNEYYKISKIPVLLNTSINGHGQPIIYDLNQPFEHLEKGTVDYLVLEDNLYWSKNEKKAD